MEKYFYTVGEVAEILGESTSLVRFWANEFPKYIRPQRNAKGNRLFRVLEMCVPVYFAGESLRPARARDNLRRFREITGQ